MKSLIMKDIRLTRFMNLWMLFIGLLFGYIGTTSIIVFKSKIIYGYGIFVMVYMFSMFSFQQDEKFKSDIILNSFPFNRDDIIMARYTTTIIYLVFSAITIFIVANISINIFDDSFIGSMPTLFDILFIIGICLLFLSMYLPFQYYYMEKAQIFNSLFYALLILLPNLISKYIPKVESIKWINNLVEMDLKTITLMLVGLGIILYFISLQLSKQIYRAKEF